MYYQVSTKKSLATTTTSEGFTQVVQEVAHLLLINFISVVVNKISLAFRCDPYGTVRLV